MTWCFKYSINLKVFCNLYPSPLKYHNVFLWEREAECIFNCNHQNMWLFSSLPIHLKLYTYTCIRFSDDIPLNASIMYNQKSLLKKPSHQILSQIVLKWYLNFIFLNLISSLNACFPKLQAKFLRITLCFLLESRATGEFWVELSFI